MTMNPSDTQAFANYRETLKLIQQAFPSDYINQHNPGGLTDRVMLYDTARRIRRADYEKNRSKA